MDKLSGRKALLVEDEAGVAIMLEDMLHDLGCEIVASVARFKQALEVARTAVVDFAILDVNLNGESALPIAHILRDRKIPIIFSTGYGATGVPPEFDGSRVLSKPFLIDELRKEIQAL